MNNLALLTAVKTADGDVLPPLLFWPLLVLFCTLFLFMLLCYLKKRAPKAMQISIYISIALCVVSAIVCIALIGKHFANTYKNDGYISLYLKNAPLYIGATVISALIILSVFLLGKNDNFKFDSRSVAFAAVCVAMSFALSYVKVFRLPQGGSVTLASLLPLLIFSYIFGVKKGFLVGIIYGVLQAIQDPWIIHPAQFLLDYPIAFSAVGMGGVFANIKALKKCPQISLLLGGIFASVIRYCAHFFSGAFAFGAYAVDKGYTNFYTYSLAYNSFVFIDILIALAVGVILFSSKAFVNEVVYKQRAKITNARLASTPVEQATAKSADENDINV